MQAWYKSGDGGRCCELRPQPLLRRLQIGFTAGGALLGAMLLRGLPWQSLFWTTSAGCARPLQPAA